jgi:hypothetical protein
MTSVQEIADEIIRDSGPQDVLDALRIDQSEETKFRLTPGTCYDEGILYMTVPARQTITKVTGKGDQKKAKDETIHTTLVITNTRKVFQYTPEEVEARGFQMPDTSLMDDTERWSQKSWLAFLRGNTEPPTTQAIHKELHDIFFDHVEYGDDTFYDLLPIFVMASYVFTIFQATTYLHFNGTRASGKSQNLRVIQALGLNTQMASNITSAALFRQIAGNPGIICIDEAESFEGERGEELRRLLNSGYAQGGNAVRMEVEGTAWKIKKFETFAPKVLASINPLEPTLQSRCIVVPMRPAIRPVPDFDHLDKRWGETRDRLYLWAMANAPRIDELKDEWNGDKRHKLAKNIAGRAWQTTQMFMILGEMIGGVEYSKKLIEFFEQYFKDMAASINEADRQVGLLRALPRVFATKQTWLNGTALSLKDIHEVSSEYLEADVREFYKTKAVSKHLTALGFRGRVAHKGGTLVLMTQQEVRDELRRRHIDPHEEDMAWFQDGTDYATTNVPTTITSDPDVPSWLDEVYD